MMQAECVILIARLCLPLDVQHVQIQNAGLGATATATSPSMTLRFQLWNDSLGSNDSGLQEFCERDGCLRYSAGAGPDGGATRLVTLRIPGEVSQRWVLVRAPNPRDLDKALDAIRVEITTTQGPAFVPLSRLPGVRP